MVELKNASANVLGKQKTNLWNSRILFSPFLMLIVMHFDSVVECERFAQAENTLLLCIARILSTREISPLGRWITDYVSLLHERWVRRTRRSFLSCPMIALE